MIRFLSFALVFAIVAMLTLANYKWHWFQHQPWIIPVVLLLSFVSGLIMRKQSRYKHLAWGLIYGSLACFVILGLRIIWILILASGM